MQNLIQDNTLGVQILPGKGIFPVPNCATINSSSDLFLTCQYQNSKISNRNDCMLLSSLFLPPQEALPKYFPKLWVCWGACSSQASLETTGESGL